MFDMLKFAANLTMLYGEHDFLGRFAAAKRDGFDAVEYLFPYAFEKQRLVERLQKHDLVQGLHNLPAGDWEKGERGIACLPDRVGEFQDGVGRDRLCDGARLPAGELPDRDSIGARGP